MGEVLSRVVLREEEENCLLGRWGPWECSRGWSEELCRLADGSLGRGRSERCDHEGRRVARQSRGLVEDCRSVHQHLHHGDG